MQICAICGKHFGEAKTLFLCYRSFAVRKILAKPKLFFVDEHLFPDLLHRRRTLHHFIFGQHFFYLFYTICFFIYSAKCTYLYLHLAEYTIIFQIIHLPLILLERCMHKRLELIHTELLM